jgi:AcrR family transcriptional regulator
MGFVGERILEVSEALLMRQGIRATTLDQVVERLGISKKTLYDYFPSKEALVEAVLDRFLQRMEQQVIQLQESHASDPVLSIVATANFAYHTLSAINPILFQELPRLAPDLQDKLFSRIRALIQKNLQTNLQNGIQQGLFRPDLDLDFIPVWMFYVLTQVILNPDFAQAVGRSIPEVYAESALLFLYSFTTEAGRHRLQEYQNLIRQTYGRSRPI